MKPAWPLTGAAALIAAASMYVLSSAAPDGAQAAPDPSAKASIVVAGGCFWCVEADLEKLDAVSEVVSGYAGGATENPTYKTYAEGGHREVAKVMYDPENTGLFGLLVYFLKHIDPTDAKGSFGDRGVEYSPAIYYETEAQKQAAERALAYVREQDVFEEELRVPVLPLDRFWKAEDYHQNYYKKSGLRYRLYRKASGRDRFIEKHWGERAEEIPESP